MPRPKRTIHDEIVVDGVSLIWRLHREQQWCTADGWKGMSILVTAAGGDHRQLFLEYPTLPTVKGDWSGNDWRTRPKISAAKVESHIRQAMQAGWDPTSRGKAFAHQVAELPG